MNYREGKWVIKLTEPDEHMLPYLPDCLEFAWLFRRPGSVLTGARHLSFFVATREWKLTANVWNKPPPGDEEREFFISILPKRHKTEMMKRAIRYASRP